jgi:hypothetical protein
MANWKKIVSSANAKKYAWPVGWETREKIAEQLECSPDRVADILMPAIKAGEIERGSFPVWDSVLQRKQLITGYRETPKNIEQVSIASKKIKLVEGGKVRRKDKSRALGTLGKENGKWCVRWASGAVTYPGKRTMDKFEFL